MSCSRLRTRASIHSPAAAPRCSRRPRARRSPTASCRARNGSRCIAKPTGSACRRTARCCTATSRRSRSASATCSRCARGCVAAAGGFRLYPAPSPPTHKPPHHNERGETLGRTGTATSGFDDLKNIAVGRLLHDNIPHVKTHWPMVTPFISQIALNFGCDDLEGTVVFERVYHEAGAPTPMWLSYDEIVTLIRGAGKEPVERDSLYQTVRTFEGYEPTLRAPARAEGPAPQGALFQIQHRKQKEAVLDGVE